MRAKVITTIGPNGWETYGKRFADSFKKFWPSDITLEIWHHDLGGKVPSYEGITFRALEETTSFQKLKAKLGAGDDREAGQGATRQGIGNDHGDGGARNDRQDEAGAEIGNEGGEGEHDLVRIWF